MKIIPLLLVLLASIVCCQHMNGVKFSTFEARRPIKYFFHLLQLKSTFNPLFYSVYSNPKSCSSKAGPFCLLAGHKSLDSYQLRSPSPEMQVIRKQLQVSSLSTFQIHQSIQRKESSLYLIRNALVNHYDMILKKSMGDFNKEEMLDEKIFKKKEQL